MNKNYTSIEAKLQYDYDAIADSFSKSRYNMHWPEVDEMLDKIKAGSKVLDLGCGTGRICRFLFEKQVDYLGVDISDKMIQHAIESCPSGKFEKGDNNLLRKFKLDIIFFAKDMFF